jgi:transcriptional regulator with PAS, ATPase and Fis domain
MQNPELQRTTSFLAKISFFSEVSQESLAQLCKGLETEVYSAYHLFFDKGDIGDEMFVIIDGAVKVHENDHVYGHLNTGECFGEYALIDRRERSAAVTATKRTEVLRISRQKFLDLMASDAGFAQSILSVMIKRHRELDSIQESLANSKREIEIINSKMSGLINGAMDAIIMFNSNFRIVLTNPSADALFENDDVIQRNVLYFFDDEGAKLIESLVNSGLEGDQKGINNYLPHIIKVIGSHETETLNEGTISKYGTEDETFYTLILRNIEERLLAEDQINLLTTKTKFLEEEIKELTSTYGIIAKDPSMKATLNSVQQVARTDATVLITGETGTGKELIARAIHKESNRQDKPLIRINCGAIPANLIESELFGHEKGAFTGAVTSRKGRFLLADKGTIFLDEIGELPLELQPKLLRVIQEGEFDPVGSSSTIKVDVRIIAATHRDLLKYTEEGKFREDLYYRLNVFPISVPSLRDRGEDITLIATEMISQFSAKLNKPVEGLSDTDRSMLMSYHWPGNVRELQNLVERAVIVSENGIIDWPSIIPGGGRMKQDPTVAISEKVLTSKELIALEKANILKALKQTRWRVSGKHGAAALLEIPPTTLASRIRALGIERPI